MARLSAYVMFWAMLLQAMTGCSPQSNEARPESTQSDRLNAALNYVDAGTYLDWQAQQLPMVILDVRTAREFTEDGHAPGAMLISYELGSERARNPRFLSAVSESISADQRVVVLCARGFRASSAARELAANRGFSNIYVFAGGYEGLSEKHIQGWKAAGLPVVYPLSPESAGRND